MFCIRSVGKTCRVVLHKECGKDVQSSLHKEGSQCMQNGLHIEGSQDMHSCLRIECYKSNSCCSTTFWFNGVHVEKWVSSHRGVPFNKMPLFCGMFHNNRPRLRV